MVPVCECGEERAACGACGRGYAQEAAAGRTPKMIEKKVVAETVSPKKAPASDGGPLVSLIQKAFYFQSVVIREFHLGK